MKFIALFLSVLLTLFVIIISFWRFDQVRIREENMEEELGQKFYEVNTNIFLELDLMLEVFTGEEDSIRSSSLDKFLITLPQRLSFWKRVALVPSLGKTLFILDGNKDSKKVISFSMNDGKLAREEFSVLTPYMAYIDPDKMKETDLMYTPLQLADDNPDMPFIISRWREYPVIILVDPEVLVEKLAVKIKNNTFSEGQLSIKGWEFIFSMMKNKEISQLEGDAYMYVYPLSSVYKTSGHEISLPLSVGIVPESLKRNKRLETILLYRQNDGYWQGPEDSSLIDGYGLWSFLRLDLKKLLFEAFKKELGWIFLVYAVLALLIVLFIILFNYSRRAKKQVQEQMRFVANISHELRTPLGVICNAGANIADGYVTDPESFRQYGELINSQGKRLTRMVESVLLYSGMLAGKDSKKSFLVDDFIPALINPVEFLCNEKGIRFEKQIEQGLSVYGDREGIHTAVLNLLYNGIIHGRSGRYLRLVIGKDEMKGGILFSVRDLGPGVPEEERKKIFAPFFRGKETVKAALPGSGIGLSLVSRVAEIHGGDIKIESQHGRGTLFILYIPSKEEQER